MPTKIEWTHIPGTIGETWNPVTGCSKISEGCKFCYAERMARRLAGRHGYPEYPHHFDVTLHPDRIEQPLKWKKPRTIFVCSMSDLFHEDIPDEFIEAIWSQMSHCPDHTFLVLTKRPARTLELVDQFTWYWTRESGRRNKVPPNIWLGITAENQATADERIPILLQMPAAVRFVSCEPLLAAVNLEGYLGIFTDGSYSPYQKLRIGVPPVPNLFTCLAKPPNSILYKKQLDWVIVGGESGPSARPMHPWWARDIRNQCQIAGVPYFHKQNGEWLHESQQVPKQLNSWDIAEWKKHNHHEWPDSTQSVRIGKKRAGRLLDGREWNEFPVMPCCHPKSAIQGNGITHWCHLCEKEGAE